MPLWFSIYLAAFIGFAAWSTADGIRKRETWPSIAIDLLADTCLVLVALGFWLASVRALLGNWAMVLLACWFAAIIGSLAPVFREHARDPLLGITGALYASATGLLGTGFVCAPLLYFGFSYAVLGGHGT